MLRHRTVFFFLVLGIVEFGFHPRGCGADTSESSSIPTVYPAKNFTADGDAIDLHIALQKYNTRAVIDILTKRVKSQRLEVTKAFRDLYEEELVTRFNDGTDFGDVFTRMLTPVPDYYAEDLNDALTSFSSDGDYKIVEILCTHDDALTFETESSYRTKYGETLKHDLSSDVQKIIYAMCVANRDEYWPVDDDLARSDAQKLFKSNGDYPSGDQGPFTEFLRERNHQQIRATIGYYKSESTISFDEAISMELSNRHAHEKDIILDIVSCIKGEKSIFAKILSKSMRGLGTDERTLSRVIVAQSDIDLGTIKIVFEELYGDSLENWVNSDTSGHYRDVLMALLASSAQ